MEDITIVEVPAQTVIGLRRTGKYGIIAEMLPELYEWAIGKGVEFTGMPIFVCHETAGEAMEADRDGTADVEVAVPVTGTVETEGDITSYELPGGTMAKTVHKGPYEECAPTYERLFQWLAENGKTVTGPTREVYLNDPREVAPEEILTEIYAPVN